jgi:hypothetical protein
MLKEGENGEKLLYNKRLCMLRRKSEAAHDSLRQQARILISSLRVFE